MAERLEDLGEWQLIERLGRFAPAGQFLDDAALLRSTGTLVVTSDVLVEGVHFSDTTTSAEDVGWRAAAANLSDLAAMGCQRGLGVTVALVAPGDTTWAWVEGVYQGLAACLGAAGRRLQQRQPTPVGRDSPGGAAQCRCGDPAGRRSPR